MLCEAAYDERTDERGNSRNGYRHRSLSTVLYGNADRLRIADAIGRMTGKAVSVKAVSTEASIDYNRAQEQVDWFRRGGLLVPDYDRDSRRMDIARSISAIGPRRRATKLSLSSASTCDLPTGRAGTPPPHPTARHEPGGRIVVRWLRCARTGRSPVEVGP